MKDVSKSIFFSYGHDCSEIVLLIKRDLERLGHRIWIDSELIRPGDNWRERITNGILGSDLVFAFLSAHSLREESVCINELAIAVGCKAGHIKTILLESGVEDKIPVMISGIHYCDMSQWRCYQEKPAEFGRWYEERLREIVHTIESPEAVEMDIQLKFLERALSPNVASARRDTELQKPFTNRCWIEKSIGQWLVQQDSSKYFLLYGGPGTGKSAFSAHYFHFNARVAGSIFCEWGCKNFSSTAQIIKSVAFQMAIKLPTYRVRLSYLMENGAPNLDACTAAELFELLLLKPTYGDTASADPVLLVIDGVDEANTGGENSLAELLSFYAARLPAFLKILITSRNDAIVQRYFSGCEALQMEANIEENHRDLIQFLRSRLREELCAFPNWRQEQILRELAQKCGSSFLYAELLVQSIRAKRMPVDDVALIPEGLYGLYFNWMHRKFPDEEQYAQEYCGAMNLIAAANFLPVEMLDKALGMKGAQLKKFLRQMKTFVEKGKNALGEECLYFFHRSFAEWLCSESADIYELCPEEGTALLARTMYLSYQNATLSDFEAEYLLEYLQHCNMPTQWKQVSADRNFLLRMLALGKAYEMVPRGFANASHIYGQLERLLELRQYAGADADALRASVLGAKGRCLFSLGNYQEAEEVLRGGMDCILRDGIAEEEMQAVSILGSILDWRGERTKSADTFRKLLLIAEESANLHYQLKAYAGLIWNDHFTNMQEALSYLSNLRQAEFDAEEAMTCSLCIARTQLSSGELGAALERYGRCVDAFDFQNGKDSYAFRKNRMMLMEILPACFDNGRYLDGLRYGLSIFSHVRNRGWLEECYCASWLALHSMRAGDLKAAEQYLFHAQACNNSITEIAKSSWMEMHLTSVEALLQFELGNYGLAIETHRKVRSLAQQCSDTWMQGDACFEILQLYLLYLPEQCATDTISFLCDELEQLGEASGLQHLKSKSLLIQSLLAARSQNVQALALLDRAREASDDFRLASMDRVEMLYMEMQIVRLCRGCAGTDRLRTEITDLTRKNSAQAYARRPLIERILNEVDTIGDKS